MNVAPRVGGVEDAPRCGPQAFVIIGDHQLHALQAAVGKAAQELGPERLCLERTGGAAQHLALAVLVDRHGDYHGMADDPPETLDGVVF